MLEPEVLESEGPALLDAALIPGAAACAAAREPLQIFAVSPDRGFFVLVDGSGLAAWAGAYTCTLGQQGLRNVDPAARRVQERRWWGICIPLSRAEHFKLALTHSHGFLGERESSEAAGVVSVDAYKARNCPLQAEYVCQSGRGEARAGLPGVHASRDGSQGFAEDARHARGGLKQPSECRSYKARRVSHCLRSP